MSDLQPLGQIEFRTNTLQVYLDPSLTQHNKPLCFIIINHGEGIYLPSSEVDALINLLNDYKRRLIPVPPKRKEIKCGACGEIMSQTDKRRYQCLCCCLNAGTCTHKADPKAMVMWIESEEEKKEENKQ